MHQIASIGSRDAHLGNIEGVKILVNFEGNACLIIISHSLMVAHEPHLHEIYTDLSYFNKYQLYT